MTDPIEVATDKAIDDISDCFSERYGMDVEKAFKCLEVYSADYYRELKRWRNMDDKPEHGQHIEIACRYPDNGVFAEVDQYNALASSLVSQFGLSDSELIPLAWRPAGEPFINETP